jgi:hypothetical protein
MLAKLNYFRDARDSMKILSLFFILFFSPNLFAAIDIGLGMGSPTSGRMAPYLTASYEESDRALSFSSGGVASYYYYHSVYTVNYLWLWNSGDMLKRPVQSGFGLGGSYAMRAFQDEGATTEEKHNDISIGPSFRVRWYLFKPVYLNMEMMWGIRNISLFGLNGQDTTVFSIGAQAW